MPYVDQVEVCVDGVPTVAPSVCQRVTGSVSLSLHNGFNELLQTQSTRTCNYLKESDSDIVSLVHLEHTLSSFTRKQLSGPVQTRGLVGPHHMIGWTKSCGRGGDKPSVWDRNTDQVSPESHGPSFRAVLTTRCVFVSVALYLSSCFEQNCFCYKEIMNLSFIMKIR